VREPHPLLVRFISHQSMSGGRALDVACGVGQNAIWLAQRAFTVDAVDISLVALEYGWQAAARACVTVNFVQAIWMLGRRKQGLMIWCVVSGSSIGGCGRSCRRRCGLEGGFYIRRLTFAS